MLEENRLQMPNSDLERKNLKHRENQKLYTSKFVLRTDVKYRSSQLGVLVY